MELFFAELRRSWIQLLRYASEAIAGILITTVVFYGLFLSANYIAGTGNPEGDRLETIIVGYLLWTLSLFIMSDIAGGIQREAQTGTLEQLFLSPYPSTQVFLTRAIASLSIQLTLLGTILVIIVNLTGTRLSFQPVFLLPFATVLLGAYGLAFAVAAMSLLLKQVQQLLGILQFGLLFLLSVPTETLPTPIRILAGLLPMTPGAGLLREVMARGASLGLVPLLIALANGAVYLSLGLLLFRVAEGVTKRRGKLAGY
ncbi:MAG: ABC transporter permease [Kaiparowitsia implicata GSE-PSE-MK54-09C]|jgi:ABC-2 type transport system permease protein|nr:ABC transporter permease [Kaiparowitsia implicata GSE-PSE-MK54-09C]